MQRNTLLITLATLLSIVLLAACVPAATPTPAPPTATAVPTTAPTATAVPAAFPITLTDGLEREVTLLAKPQRIVSLAPSNTEILFAVGAGVRSHLEAGRDRAHVLGVLDFLRGLSAEGKTDLARGVSCYQRGGCGIHGQNIWHIEKLGECPLKPLGSGKAVRVVIAEEMGRIAPPVFLQNASYLPLALVLDPPEIDQLHQLFQIQLRPLRGKYSPAPLSPLVS